MDNNKIKKLSDEDLTQVTGGLDCGDENESSSGCENQHNPNILSDWPYKDIEID